MHRNTYLLVGFLAVFTALVIGVNLGRRSQTPATNTPSTPLSTPTLATLHLTNDYCGIEFSYPSNLTKLDSASGSSVLVNPQNADETVVIICQKDIPRSPLPPEKIETVAVGSVSAKLYHDASARDGKPIDNLIFRHPQKNLDIFIGGYGSVFNSVVRSLKILP